MTENKITHTPKAIEEYFQLSYEIGQTLGSKLYRALAIEDSRPVSIWMTKVDYKLDSFDAHQALDHLHAIDKIDPPVAPAEMYGADSEGVFFVTFYDNLQDNLASQRGTIGEMERRFFKIVRLVHRVHQSNNFFGDLNPCCFWLNNTGDINLTGILKLPKASRKVLFKDCDPENLIYVAPEVLDGNAPSKKSDVYSLGMIGFHLLCNQFPYVVNLDAKNLPNLKSSSGFKSLLGLHEEMLEILFTAVSEDPAERYNSAAEMVEAIIGAHEKTSKEKSFVKSGSDSGVSALPAVRRATMDPIQVEADEDLADKLVNKSYKLVLYSVIILVGLAIAAGALFYRQYQERLAREINQATAPFTGGNPELNNAVATISDLSADTRAKIDEIKKLIKSADPLSYNLIVTNYINATEAAIARSSRDAIIKKLKESGLNRAAVQLDQWLRYSRKTPQDPIFVKVLKALDPAMPFEERYKLLSIISNEDLNIATRLSAALFFDQGSDDSYQALLLKQIGQKLAIADAKELSSLGLIMHHEALSQIFLDDINSNIKLLSDADIKSILPILIKRNDLNFNSVVNLAIDNKVFSPVGEYMLKVMLAKDDIDAKVSEALINLTLDKVSDEHVGNLVAWRDPESEKILYLLCAYLANPQDRLSVMDSLAVRSLSSQPGSGLLRWIRDSQWQNRINYVQPMGVLAVSDIFDEDRVKEALKAFSKSISNSALQTALLKSNDERVLKIILGKYSSKLTLVQKVNLLKHPSKLVKERVISKIKTNDVGAMKLISDAYSKETDQDIKQLYKKQFWFIKE